MVKQLRGAFPILTTPCDKNGDLDLESLRNEVEWCIENGVDGFFLGNCSEMYAFSHEDRHRITETVIDAANGKATLAAGTMAGNTGEAVKLSKDAEDLGADAIFMHGPIQRAVGYRTLDSGVDIVEHYRRVDRAVDIPIVMYNTPMGAPGIMPPERLHNIIDACPGIKYMKTGEPTVPIYQRTIAAGVGEKVKILCGKSHMNFRFLMAYPKAVGFTACIASVLPAEHVEMWNYFRKGDYDKARETWMKKISPLVEIWFIGGAVNVRREALHQMGIIKTTTPIVPFAANAVLDDFHKKELREYLKLLGKL